MVSSQTGILAPLPAHGRFVSLSLRGDAMDTGALRQALSELAKRPSDASVVVGIGRSTVAALGKEVPGLREVPHFDGERVPTPSTPAALWLWLRGDNPGTLLHLDREIMQLLSPAFSRDEIIDGFFFGGHDLTGYEDGTENPALDNAPGVALASGSGAGLDGSSYVAVQRWVHSLDEFQRYPQDERDNMIGRRLSDNEELEDAPETSHVKRSAQESFEPDAFMWRRSMPWMSGDQSGLMFVAFGKSFDAFEAILRRMVGAEDGQVDALYRFSKPVTGSYFWCPPLKDNLLDLSALGL